MLTPIPIFAPVDRPPESDVDCAAVFVGVGVPIGVPVVCPAVADADRAVVDADVDVLSFVAASRTDTSVLCHMTTTPFAKAQDGVGYVPTIPMVSQQCPHTNIFGRENLLVDTFPCCRLPPRSVVGST